MLLNFTHDEMLFIFDLTKRKQIHNTDHGIDYPLDLARLLDKILKVIKKDVGV